MAVRRRVHYGWIVVGVTFGVMVVTAGVRATPGVLIVPFESYFHWSRATISFAVGVNLLLYGLMGPFAAALMDRFGVRRTIGAALTVIVASVAATPAMREAWQLVMLWGVLIGCGCGLVGNFLAALVATRWFHRRQGLVVGLLTAANAAGQLIFLPAIAALLDAAGWRLTSLVLAAVVLALMPFAAILMRDRPGDLGLARYGETGSREPAPPAAGNPVGAAFRALADAGASRDFWLLAGAYLICGATTNGLIATHLIPACVDHGIAEMTGAGLLAATAAFSFVGGTLSGWFTDRWDSRVLLAWYYGLRGLSLIYLPFAFRMSFVGLLVFGVFYGLDWIASVPPTVRLLTRIVGSERAAIMVAWVTVIHQVGAAAAAYLGGVLRAAFGTYVEAFLLAGLLCLGAAVMALCIGVGGPARSADAALATP
jgi:MFS family permease